MFAEHPKTCKCGQPIEGTYEWRCENCWVAAMIGLSSSPKASLGDKVTYSIRENMQFVVRAA